MPHARRLAVCLIAGAAVAVPTLALAQQQGERTDPAPTSQQVFRDALLADDRVSSAVKRRLREKTAFVDTAPQFGDLTGDGRADAVVRVVTQGSAGAVAVYVLSTDGRAEGAELRSIYRNQSLHRVVARVSGGSLLLTVPAWKRGDDVCCPRAYTERTYRWSRASRAFRRVASRSVQRPVEPTS